MNTKKCQLIAARRLSGTQSQHPTERGLQLVALESDSTRAGVPDCRDTELLRPNLYGSEVQ